MEDSKRRESASFGAVVAELAVPAKFRFDRQSLARGEAMRPFWHSIFAVLCFAACSGAKSVECALDTNCDLGSGGVCTVAPSGSQWCAYTDDSCDSGIRYADTAGDGLAEECVEGRRFKLELHVDGTGSGSISSDLAAFSCSEASCVIRVPEGTTVNLSATAVAGDFLGWSEACRGKAGCIVTMDSDQEVRAYFGSPGAALWAKQLGSGSEVIANAISVDSDGNLIVVGEFARTLAVAPGIELTAASASPDAFVVKLDSANGNVIWARRFGGNSYDTSSRVSVDGANNIYVLGQFASIVDFGDGPRSAVGLDDVFLLKLDPQGSLGWVRTIGSSSFDRPSALAVNGDALLISGTHFGPVAVDAVRLSHVGAADIFVLRLEASTGAVSWGRAFGSASDDFVNGAALDSSGNVVIVGRFASPIDFGGGRLSPPGDFWNAMLVKLSATGGHLLSKQFGASGFDSAEAAAVDAVGNVIIAGAYEGSAMFECPNVPPSSQPGETDIFVAKYTPAGSCVWVRSSTGVGGVYGRKASAVAVNDAGEVAVTGTYDGSLSIGGETFTAPGFGTDVFSARFDGKGNHLNSLRAGGVGFENSNGIAQTSDGRFFVVGFFQEFAEFGSYTFEAIGERDGFIVGHAPL